MKRDFYAALWNLWDWDAIPSSLHFQFLKLLGDLHILVKNAVFFMACDILDRFGIHSQNDAIGDESLPGSMVGDQFPFWF